MRPTLQYWMPLAAWTVVILVASGPGFGSAHTGALLERILAALAGHPVPAADYALLHLALRKLAHICGYGIEGLLAYRAISGGNPGFRWQWWYVALGITAVVACVDELNQSFFPARTGSAWDVLLDIAGGALAQLLFVRRNRTP